MCNEYICSHFIESYYKQKTGVINMNQVFSLSSRNLQSEGYKTNIQIRVQTEIHSLIHSPRSGEREHISLEKPWSLPGGGDTYLQQDRGLQWRRLYP